jgi:very-short-patch-repair endonuclease
MPGIPHSDTARRLQEDRKFLLELSGLNPLLNYRTPKAKGLETALEETPALLWQLLEGQSVKFVTTAETNEAAKSTRIPVPDNDLKQLSDRLLKTMKEAESHIEEQGVNVLFLVLGMLEWKETESAEKSWRSPLLLLPVELTRSRKLDAGGYETFDLAYNEEEIEPNYSLIAALKDRYGLDLPPMPGFEACDTLLAVQQQWQSWLNEVGIMIGSRPGWQVQRQALALGFFAFSKYWMYRDLAPEKWFTPAYPDGPVLLSRLLVEGFDEGPSPVPGDFHFDAQSDLEQPATILDLDSSQARVVLEARAGRNLVVQGPPGTGKSQTIANLIADAVYNGKKILFVAEKMAALEVVKNRLTAAGLGHTCLELHGAKARKSQFVQELKQTMEQPVQARLSEPMDLDRLRDARNLLRKWSDAVHLPLASGYSPYELMGLLQWAHDRLKGVDFPVPGTASAGLQASWESYLANLTKSQVGTHEQPGEEALAVQLLEQLSGEVTQPDEHVLRGIALEQAPPPSRIEALQQEVVQVQQKLQQLQQTIAAQSIPVPQWTANTLQETARLIDQLLEAVALPDSWFATALSQPWLVQATMLEKWIADAQQTAALKATALQQVKEPALQADIAAAREIVFAKSDNLWNRWFNGTYKQAKRTLQSWMLDESVKDTMLLKAAADAVLAYQAAASQLEKGQVGVQPFFGAFAQLDQSNFDLLERGLKWSLQVARKIQEGVLPVGYAAELTTVTHQLPQLDESRKAIQAAYDEAWKAMQVIQTSLAIQQTRIETFRRDTFEQLQQQLLQIKTALPGIATWVQWYRLGEQARTTGKNLLVHYATSWKGGGAHLLDYYRLKAWETLWQQAITERPVLQQEHGKSLDQWRQTFIQLDQQLKQHYRAEIMNRHAASTAQLGSNGQAGFLRSNVQKKRNIPPVRSFLQQSFEAIALLKPVFMMSPLSVAAYLEARPGMFDLVIFDEASQVEPVDAYGSIVRGKQVLVVGDTRQMPPTHFFKKMLAEDLPQSDTNSDNLSGSVDSIMEVMLGRNVPSQTLQWHYRSQHDSLIQVSNRHFYENQLVVFPSARRAGNMLGLTLHQLDHATHPYEGQGVNRAEAKVVAREVLQFAQQYPGKTLGVVAFNIRQRDAIDQELMLLARDYPELAVFMNKTGKTEPFFVKNLENVQGDERDVIFISVGYGKTANGTLVHNFGALNQDGGERRLNVLITRARQANYIFSNFAFSDLDLSRTRAKAMMVLRDFLEYAAIQGSEVSYTTAAETASLLETQVADALRAQGFEIKTKVGSAGYRLDMAIQQPGADGTMALGIECDGLTYHRTRSARDRDRLRQVVLEKLGWKLFRLWSTDWFYNREQTLQKITAAIRAATVEVPASPLSEETKPQQVIPELAPEPRIIVETARTAVVEDFPAFKLADTGKWTKVAAFKDLSDALLERYVLQVVTAEAPIAPDQVCRRIADAMDLILSSKVRARIEAQVQQAVQRGQLALRDGFVTLPGDEPVSPRDFGKHPYKHIDIVSPFEQQQAMLHIIKTALSITAEELLPETANRLGFRYTAPVQQALGRALEQLLQSKQVAQEGVHLVPVK